MHRWCNRDSQERILAGQLFMDATLDFQTLPAPISREAITLDALSPTQFW